MIPRLLLTFLSVGLFALCFPEGPLPLAAFGCLVPLAIALSGATARSGLLLGFLYGFSIWLASVWWLSNGLYYYVELPWSAAWFWTAVGCVVSSVPYALFGYLCGLFDWMERPFGPFRCALALAVLLAWYPLLYPGNHVHSLYSVPLAIQVLDLGGVPLLLFMVNLVNFLVAGVVLDLANRRSPATRVVAAALVVGMTLSYGAYRLKSLHNEIGNPGKGQTIKVVSVQPNLPVMRSGVPQVFGLDKKLRGTDSVLSLTTEAVKRYPDAQLVVWPELPGAMPCNPEWYLWRKVRGLARKSEIAFIVNCAEYDRGRGGDYNNAQLILDTGEFGPRYRKMILFPFGEYLPFEKRLPWLRKLFPHALNYIPGKETTLLPIGSGVRVIATLCYEVLFTGLIREFAQRGGNVVVNLTDDAWFGLSDASAIHMALAVYRTVEYRVPLVRVTNSGNGVFVQPTGEIVAGSRTAVFRPAVTSFPLFIPKERSLYFDLGDFCLFLLTLVFGIDAILLAYLNQREKRPK